MAWSAERIKQAAIDGGADPNSRILGVYYEGGWGPNFPYVSADLEYVRFVGYDTQTDKLVTSNYIGASISGGGTLFGTNVGGGVFGYTGSPRSLAGYSFAGQLSAGITTGLGTNVDGDVLAFGGGNTSIGVTGSIGYTYRVAVDGEIIFERGLFGRTSNFETNFSGFEYDRAINSLINSASGRVEILIEHPDGYLITQTLQRVVQQGDGYLVNVTESITDLDGQPVPAEIRDQYIEKRTYKTFVKQDDNLCFAADTPIEMADGTTKPIEDIRLGDEVLAFDADADGGQGAKVPKRVTQLHRTENQPLINFHGTHVTPGHVYLTGEGTFLPIIEILQNDGTVVNSDGKVIRARTGWEVGSREDNAIPIGYPDGDEIKLTTMRAGTLYGGKDNVAYTIEQMMNSRGYHMMSDGRFIGVEGDIKTAYWEWGVPDDKMIAGKYASYADLVEGSAIGIGMPLVPTRPN